MAQKLLASAPRTGSGSSVVDDKIAYALARCSRASFLLDVTAAATLVGDTVAVFVQSSLDGVTFDDFVAFTLVLGNGGAKKIVAYWQGVNTPTTPLGLAQDGAMSPGVKQGPLLGATFRVKWTVVGTGSFTFAVSAQGIQ